MPLPDSFQATQFLKTKVKIKKKKTVAVDGQNEAVDVCIEHVCVHVNSNNNLGPHL